MSNLVEALAKTNDKRASDYKRMQALAVWLYDQLAQTEPRATLADRGDGPGPLTPANNVFDVGVDGGAEWIRVSVYGKAVAVTAWIDNRPTPQRITRAKWDAISAIAALRLAQASAKRSHAASKR